MVHWYILEYPLGIGWSESRGTTRTSGEGEVCGAGEATKARWASSRRGYAATLQTLFAHLVINSALVLVTEHLEGFGDLGGGVSSLLFSRIKWATSLNFLDASSEP